MFTTKAEANIQYIKSELEALSDGGSLQEIALDPIQVLLILEHVSVKFRLSDYMFSLDCIGRVRSVSESRYSGYGSGWSNSLFSSHQESLFYVISGETS